MRPASQVDNYIHPLKRTTPVNLSGDITNDYKVNVRLTATLQATYCGQYINIVEICARTN